MSFDINQGWKCTGRGKVPVSDTPWVYLEAPFTHQPLMEYDNPPEEDDLVSIWTSVSDVKYNLDAVYKQMVDDKEQMEEASRVIDKYQKLVGEHYKYETELDILLEEIRDKTKVDILVVNGECYCLHTGELLSSKNLNV